MQVRDDVILGLDIGVGSLGWALLEEDLQTGEQRLLQRQTPQGETTYALGVRLFHVPENAKTKELLNVKRRTARMQRRTTARRAQRMRRVRALLDSLGVPGVRDADAFHLGKGRGAQCDPWQLRREGLERRLEAREWAVVLLHIAKHRGFRSNSKTDRSGSDKEMGQVLQAVSNLQQEVEASGLTVGALLASRERRRNRADHTGAPRYDLCMLRSLQENEVDILFTRQRELGNPLAGEEVRCRYAELAFAQRPLAPVSHMVGPCAFLEGERRAPRFAPTAELFRYVQALCNMRLRQETGEETPLSEEQRQAACAVFGSVQSVTYKKLRQVLRLPAGCRFAGLSYGVTEKGNVQDPEKADVAMRTGKCCQGTACLRGILGDAYEALHEQRLDEADAARLAATGALSAPAAALLARGMAGLRLTDAVARIVSELNDLDQIRAVLALLPLAAPRIAALSQAAGEGKLGIFQGTARLSLRAMEAILPHMLACGEYAAACELAGFDPRAAQKTDVTDIRNPVVLRVFREVRRQFSAICREFGFLPGRVHVELLREVGKSGEERNRISRGLERRTKEKEAARKAVAQLLGKSPETVSAGEVQRYELWRQQDGKCAYYMLWRHAGGERAYGDAMPQGSIPPDWLADGVNAVQVDHILPRSRTFDNSFHNLCLCCHAANQAKGGRTPWEWLGAAQPQAWHDFEQWVQSLPLKGLKKRNYLLRDLNAEVQGRFHARNLTDSGYVARLTLRWLEEEYARHDVPMQDAAAFLRTAGAGDGLFTPPLGRAGTEKDRRPALRRPASRPGRPAGGRVQRRDAATHGAGFPAGGERPRTPAHPLPVAGFQRHGGAGPGLGLRLARGTRPHQGPPARGDPARHTRGTAARRGDAARAVRAQGRGQADGGRPGQDQGRRPLPGRGGGPAPLAGCGQARGCPAPLGTWRHHPACARLRRRVQQRRGAATGIGTGPGQQRRHGAHGHLQP